MIEIGLGILAAAAGAAIVLGPSFAPAIVPPGPYLLLGPWGTTVLVGFGLILVVRGAYRLERKRQSSDQHWLRTCGLMLTTLLITLCVVFAPLLLVELLNLVKIGGFPLGFYMAAQGILVAIAIVAFVFSAYQDRIDVDESGTGH
jgi:putative solute:sodium symporter small subunit